MGTQGENAQLRVEAENGVLSILLSGDWCLSSGLSEISGRVRAAFEESAGEEVRELMLDTRAIGKWDSAVMPVILEAYHLASEKELEWRDEHLSEGLKALLGLATAVDEKEGAVRKARDRNVFEQVGDAVIELRSDADVWLKFLGDCLLGFLDILRGRARFRWRDFWLTMQKVGPDALPIVTLISFLVGLIVAFLGAVVLVRFGASYYVSYLVGYGMLREMGALMVGIIMSGRTGAAFAAEIGSMKVNEEIDALETLGINPIVFIVFPRMLALFLLMPLLVIFADLIGVLSGMMISNLMLDQAVPIFMKGFLEAVGLPDFLLGIGKGVCFGMIVAASGCLRGLLSGKSADSVGQAATSAVVTSITLIVACNTLIDYFAATFGI
ncbi:MAG: MlaE family ABC transporter permease [Opitutales bacterium]